MKNIIFFLGIFFTTLSFAKLNVITTTTDLSAITEEVGKNLITVDSIAKGTQDPHFIEAKPSYMLKMSKADLVISIGLDLEIGWLPSLIQGSRNPSIRQGGKGFLEVGTLVSPLEVPSGNVTRADGDVHPFGNPHVTLDPIRAGEIAVMIANKLGELDPANKAQFLSNANSLQTRLENKTKTWSERIKKSGIKKIITYHKTLTYFLNRFQILNPAILEPKPGIPPTSGHILEIIELIKSQKIYLILVENYFDPSVTNKIKDQISLVRAETVPVSVLGDSNIKSLDDLYENLVLKIEGK